MYECVLLCIPGAAPCHAARAPINDREGQGKHPSRMYALMLQSSAMGIPALMPGTTSQSAVSTSWAGPAPSTSRTQRPSAPKTRHAGPPAS